MRNCVAAPVQIALSLPPLRPEHSRFFGPCLFPRLQLWICEHTVARRAHWACRSAVTLGTSCFSGRHPCLLSTPKHCDGNSHEDSHRIDRRHVRPLDDSRNMTSNRHASRPPACNCGTYPRNPCTRYTPAPASTQIMPVAIYFAIAALLLAKKSSRCSSERPNRIAGGQCTHRRQWW